MTSVAVDKMSVRPLCR